MSDVGQSAATVAALDILLSFLRRETGPELGSRRAVILDDVLIPSLLSAHLQEESLQVRSCCR